MIMMKRNMYYNSINNRFFKQMFNNNNTRNYFHNLQKNMSITTSMNNNNNYNNMNTTSNNIINNNKNHHHHHNNQHQQLFMHQHQQKRSMVWLKGTNHSPVLPNHNANYLIKSIKAYIPQDVDKQKDDGGLADCHAQGKGHWIVDTPIANPMSIYPEYKANRTSWGIDAIGSVVVEIELLNGLKGYGISIGGIAAAFMIENHFSRFIEGQDPNNVELIWDQLYKASTNYGRKGLPVQAISGVDLALWDVLGQLRKEPVYNLLGGKTKEKLPVYSTNARPDLAKNKFGFIGSKIPLPYGPGDGEEGMIANIKQIQHYRASVGEDFPLMVDCFMSLTVPYAIELIRRIDREVPNGVKWVEEALHPDNYDGYAEIKRKVGHLTMITTGEHEYTRYGFRQLLERDCCDVLQPDITWMGGITEARRICAMASAHDKPVVPHGSSIYSYHLQFSQPNSPFAEFLNMSPESDHLIPYLGKLFYDEPLPENGYITLPSENEKYGFGVTIRPYEELNLYRPYENRKSPTAEEVRNRKLSSTPTNGIWTEQAREITKVPIV